VGIKSKIWQKYLCQLGLQSHKKSFNSEGVGLEMSLFCVYLMWNDPYAVSLNVFRGAFNLNFVRTYVIEDRVNITSSKYICKKETMLNNTVFILVSQDIVQWRDLVNEVMNIRFPQRTQNFLNS
jgi:hypothetical protein